MTLITPVLLCGGSGTRLWPVSRKSFPKQFSPLFRPNTLFQQAVERLSGPEFAAPLVMTGNDFRFIVAEQLDAMHVTAASILLEPAARNTGPAILASAFLMAQADPDALILAAPCDHLIPDAEAFRSAVHQSVALALAGRIVTFGVRPTRAETGYGWLELDGEAEGKPSNLRRFVEKPGPEAAAQMLQEGRFLWNAGIFLCRASTLIQAFAQHAADLIPPVRAAVAAAKPDLGFLRLDAAHWGDVRAVSIDYAVMERAANLSVTPFDSGWSDLGDWASIQRERERDPHGNSLSGAATALDCTGSLLFSDEHGLSLVGIGLTDMIAIATADAVLVAPASRAQDVRLAVDALKAKGARAAEQFRRDHRPWGWFETLAAGDRFQVKRIVVNPGAALSLQSHRKRAEHWVVVSGTARVTIGEEIRLVGENQSVYIAQGQRHRLENPGKRPMILIEVQTGAYLGEDDIIRYADNYARD